NSQVVAFTVRTHQAWQGLNFGPLEIREATIRANAVRIAARNYAIRIELDRRGRPVRILNWAQTRDALLARLEPALRETIEPYERAHHFKPGVTDEIIRNVVADVSADLVSTSDVDGLAAFPSVVLLMSANGLEFREGRSVGGAFDAPRLRAWNDAISTSTTRRIPLLGVNITELRIATAFRLRRLAIGAPTATTDQAETRLPYRFRGAHIRAHFSDDQSWPYKLRYRATSVSGEGRKRRLRRLISRFFVKRFDD
ncbi:MAG: hypothetical protein AAFR23_03015, partial [Pseudomonadota bacterium]